jgi:hypothetical protein
LIVIGIWRAKFGTSEHTISFVMVPRVLILTIGSFPNAGCLPNPLITIGTAKQLIGIEASGNASPELWNVRQVCWFAAANFRHLTIRLSDIISKCLAFHWSDAPARSMEEGAPNLHTRSGCTAASGLANTSKAIGPSGQIIATRPIRPG